MLLKLFVLLVALSLGAALLMRQPHARRLGWMVTGLLVVFGLLVLQILRTLDMLLR